MYIIYCHACQTFKSHKRFDRPFNRRTIDINAPALSHISMDIKHMPPSKDKFSYILVMLCEISDFIVAVPMRTATAPEICEAIMENFIGYFGTPTRIVCDQDPVFMSHLTQWFLKSYGIHVTTTSPTNDRYRVPQFIISRSSPRRSCEPQVQEHACPTRTYACLAKHHSK